MTHAYDQGVLDKLDDILEPEPPYTPGSQEYKDYVEGYLSTVTPVTYGSNIGSDHHVNF